MNLGVGDMLETDEFSWLKGTLKYRYCDAGKNRTEALGYHLNGNLKFKYFLVNSELHGSCKFWDEEGHLSLEETYAKGMLQGVRRKWYLNCNLESEEYYEKGLRQGVSKLWYLDGKLRCQCVYLNGRRHGLSLEWHPNGKLFQRKGYESGLLHGVCEQRDENGNIKEKKIYSRGVLVPPKVQEIINSGKLTAQFILKIRNTGLRRICLEQFGYGRFLNQMPHEIIHREEDCELVRIAWHKREEAVCLVKVKCPSTGAFYTLRVPPSMKRVKQAIAWTFGKKEEEYVPNQET